MFMNFLNPEGQQNPISGSKVKAILLKGWILSIERVASGRVYVCSLHSRLVFSITSYFFFLVFIAECCYFPTASGILKYSLRVYVILEALHLAAKCQYSWEEDKLLTSIACCIMAPRLFKNILLK